jgi:hypothetical protein
VTAAARTGAGRLAGVEYCFGVVVSGPEVIGSAGPDTTISVVWGVGLLACQLPASTMAGIGISANPPVESAEEAEETEVGASACWW